MSGDRGYASVPERITWTTGFRCATDKLVLGALSTFANFETGKGARMGLRKLTARATLPRRTVQRGLQRLEADGWIVARRQHRHATSWDINMDRLAKDWVGAKLVGGVMPSFPQGDKNLNVTSGAQERATHGAQLNATGGAQGTDLRATRGAQTHDLSATGGAPIPSTYRTPVEPIPSAPALRAGLFENPDDEKPAERHAPQPAPATADVRANREHHPDDAADDVDRYRSPDRSAPGARVPLRQGSDSPGSESVDRPRPPMEPQQQTFGPIDVSPSPARPTPQWGQLAEALREGLKRKSG